LVSRKGVDYLIDAIPLITGTYNNILFVFVGDGYLKEGLLQRTREYKITEYVRFVGQKSRDEVPLWMNAADIFVLPSLSEGRPTVVLEAMACGLPVVATNVSGTPEIVEDGKTGFLIEPKNPADIAEKILTLVVDDRLMQDMGENGLCLIEREGLTWENNVDRIGRLYEELAEGKL
jgi:glycosyltransferase involved in cell wall biosynthesis